MILTYLSYDASRSGSTRKSSPVTGPSAARPDDHPPVSVRMHKEPLNEVQKEHLRALVRTKIHTLRTSLRDFPETFKEIHARKNGQIAELESILPHLEPHEQIPLFEMAATPKLRTSRKAKAA